MVWFGLTGFSVASFFFFGFGVEKGLGSRSRGGERGWGHTPLLEPSNTEVVGFAV